MREVLLQIESEFEMFRDTKAFSGFSVVDVEAARTFYGETLGLNLTDEPIGFTINIAGGTSILVYGKEDHVPATYTIINFPVSDIGNAVDELTAKGVAFETYPGENGTDERGIFWGAKASQGPNIAWFKDPAGNFLSVIEQ